MPNNFSTSSMMGDLPAGHCKREAPKYPVAYSDNKHLKLRVRRTWYRANNSADHFYSVLPSEKPCYEQSGLLSTTMAKVQTPKQPLPKGQTAEGYVQYHKDGSVWAKGQTLDRQPTGYWEWFRKDGTKLRSGTFANGEQIGEWTTYDKSGAVYKVTTIKRRVAP